MRSGNYKLMTCNRASQRAGQRALQSLIKSALAIGLCASLTGASNAADQVVMPYRCEAAGPGITLTPSPLRPYEIAGRHEQDIVTACAPDNPNRCRTWRLHRFEIDCGGVRVPWIDVVAAANAQSNGPAKVRNGRLYVRMDPWWARQRPPVWAGRPRLREFDDGDPRPGSFGGPSQSHAPSVEMPLGFAPVVGMTAHFSAGSPAAQGSDRDVGAIAESAQGTGTSEGNWDYKKPAERMAGAPPAPVEKLRPVPETPAKPAAAPATAPASPPAQSKTSTRDPGHTFAPKTAEVTPADAKPTAAIENLPDTKSDTGKAPDKNVAQAAPAPAAAGASAPASPASPVIATVPETPPTINSVAPLILNRPGAETAAITSATSSSGDQSGTQAAGADQTIPATLESAPATPATTSVASWPVISGLGALFMISAGMAYVIRRRAVPTANANRDFSAVSLDGTRSRELVPASLVQPPVLSPTGPQEPAFASTLAQALSAKAPPLPETFIVGASVEPEWLPVSREEALHVLGAGPDASDVVLKKIVDGLRMSWHPDHAKSDEDLRLRSERMTQINVAWDILSSRQAPAKQAAAG